jgi:hypothetical protein
MAASVPASLRHFPAAGESVKTAGSGRPQEGQGQPDGVGRLTVDFQPQRHAAEVAEVSPTEGARSPEHG